MNDIKTLPFDTIRTKINEATQTSIKEHLVVYNKITKKRIAETLNVSESEIPDSKELPEDIVSSIEKECFLNIRTKFINHFKLADKHTWVLPQMMAAFGSWKVVDNDPKLTYLENTEDPFNYGLWVIARSNRRDLINPDKDKPIYKLSSYNNLVPLILAGLKKYQNIPYNSWKKEEIGWLVDLPLAEAMNCKLPEMNNTVKLEIRNGCLLIESGKRQGQYNKPESSFKLFHLDKFKEYDLKNIPILALHMLLQTWCAHPSNRNKYMILNPSDWDDMPEPLVSTDIYIKETSKLAMPW